MKARPLGCFAPVGLASSAVVTLLTALIVLFSGGTIFSPGALNHKEGSALGGVSSHAGLNGNCGACHTSPWSGVLMATRCLDCHTSIRIELSQPNSLHGMLDPGLSAPRCQDCHTEHKGPNAALTKYTAMNIPHEKLGFSLASHMKFADGRPFTCQDCHTDFSTKFDQGECSTCHQKLDTTFMQSHLTAYGPACLGCHDGIETYGKAFDHAKQTFTLIGKHQTVNCVNCHAGAKTIANMKATPVNCFACHQKDDTHQGDLGQDCGSCHIPDGWDKASFDHSKATFPLTGAHITVACANCHINDVFKGTPTNCFACHEKDDHHNGAFGQDCAACHITDAWNKVTFDHSKTFFPLTGAHINVDCTQCHINNVFKGTPTNCFACHQKDDRHNGGLGQDCAACHVTDAWNKVTFDHSQTGFPLTGAHVNVDCTKCHVNNVFSGTSTACYACHQKDDHHNGTFGQDCAACHGTDAWSNVTFDHSKTAFPLTGAHASLTCLRCHVNGIFKGTTTQCVGCHQDPAYHRGLFGTGCAGCHNTSAWIPATFNRPHAFPINHGGASTCKSCHPSTLGAYTCFSCHNQADMQARHAAQGINDISNCVSCHPNGTTGS